MLVDHTGHPVYSLEKIGWYPSALAIQWLIRPSPWSRLLFAHRGGNPKQGSTSARSCVFIHSIWPVYWFSPLQKGLGIDGAPPYASRILSSRRVSQLVALTMTHKNLPSDFKRGHKLIQTSLERGEAFCFFLMRLWYEYCSFFDLGNHQKSNSNSALQLNSKIYCPTTSSIGYMTRTLTRTGRATLERVVLCPCTPWSLII